MSKGKVYTLLVFLLSFTVVFGGWFLTKGLLHRKEVQILSKKGQVSMERAEVDIKEKDTEIKQGFYGKVLSEDIKAEILTVWETGGREVPHEPMAGQMVMEDAIAAGISWIDLLSENNILPAYLSEASFDDINAVLCTLDSKGTLNDSLISYWKVTYVKDDVKIILKIHAVSGEVWMAEIYMHEDKMLYSCSDEEVIAVAFPFMKVNSIDIIVENDKAYKINNKVYAIIKRDSIVVNKQEPMARLLLSLCTDIR